MFVGFWFEERKRKLKSKHFESAWMELVEDHRLKSLNRSDQLGSLGEQGLRSEPEPKKAVEFQEEDQISTPKQLAAVLEQKASVQRVLLFRS